MMSDYGLAWCPECNEKHEGKACKPVEARARALVRNLTACDPYAAKTPSEGDRATHGKGRSMTEEPNYARAVAHYLMATGHNLPKNFDPELVTRMTCDLKAGYAYSTHTFEDPTFDLWLWSDDQQNLCVVDLRNIDLPELIREAVNHL